MRFSLIITRINQPEQAINPAKKQPTLTPLAPLQRIGHTLVGTIGRDVE